MIFNNKFLYIIYICFTDTFNKFFFNCPKFFLCFLLIFTIYFSVAYSQHTKNLSIDSFSLKQLTTYNNSNKNNSNYLKQIKEATLFAQEVQNPRIISISPEITQLLIKLNSHKQLVGIDINSTLTSNESKDYQYINSLPKVADFYSISNEKINFLKPDIIIGTKSFNQISLHKLKKHNTKILLLNFENIFELFNSIELLGIVLNKRTEAQEINKEISNVITSQIKNSLSYPNSTSKYVAIAIWHKPIIALGRNNLLNDLLFICNAKNPFQTHPTPFFTASLEKIKAKKIDILLNISNQTFKLKETNVITVSKELSNILNKSNSDTIIKGLPKLCEIINP